MDYFDSCIRWITQPTNLILRCNAIVLLLVNLAYIVNTVLMNLFSITQYHWVYIVLVAMYATFFVVSMYCVYSDDSLASYISLCIYTIVLCILHGSVCRFNYYNIIVKRGKIYNIYLRIICM
jgi:hypothetical protein